MVIDTMRCQVHTYWKYLWRDINIIIHLTIFGMQCMYNFFSPIAFFIQNMPLISLVLNIL